MKVKEPQCRFKTVMLVDDSELDNFINEKIMQSIHFAKTIYSHTSARSALEFINNLETMGQQHESAIPEVIFVDLNMPIMDGFQFLEKVFKNHKSLMSRAKTVVLTSSIDTEDRSRAIEMSPSIVFMNKPLTKKMLTEL